MADFADWHWVSLGGSVSAALWSWYSALSIKRQEARLRVDGEIQMQLFTRMTQSAEEAARVLWWFTDLKDYPRTRPTTEALSEHWVALRGSGLFLPPDLDVPYQNARAAVESWFEVVERPRKAQEPFPDVDAAHVAAEKAAEFCTNYMHWKNAEYNRLRGVTS